jgi:peptide/nickel transport system substrate-binding protein
MSLCAALAAFATQARGAPAHDVLTIGMVQFPPDLHPSIVATSVKTLVLGAALRNLTGFDRTGHVRCILCTEVPSLANGRARLVPQPDGTQGMEVTFTLRPDLFWADGVPVTAADFVFGDTVNRAFNPDSSLIATEAPDASTFRIRRRVVRYDFDRWELPPISEHVEGAVFRAAAGALQYGQQSAFNRHPETPGLWMGPYRITQYRPADGVTLAPNPFWKGDAPAFRQVQMRLVENTSALQANLLAGDVDTVASGNIGLTLDQLVALSHSAADRFDFTFTPLVNSYEHLAVQLDNPLLADRRTRQAIAMAIDRQAIVGKLFGGQAEVANSFKHPSQAGADPDVKVWPYDPAAARKLLAEVGFRPGDDGVLVSPAGTRFAVDIVSTAGNRARELIELVIQSELKAVGIELRIRNEPARSMFGETLRKRHFDGFVEFQSDQPQDWVPYLTFGSEWVPSAANNWAGTNYMDFRDPEMDRALDAARAALDPAQRAVQWKRIIDIAAEALPEIDLFYPTNATVTPKWLTGVVDPVRYGPSTTWIEDWRVR